MANEDVLERADEFLATPMGLTVYEIYAVKVACQLLTETAAALREAREERELICTLAKQYKANPVNAYDRPSSWGKLDALIDAAMKPPGGEDGA